MLALWFGISDEDEGGSSRHSEMSPGLFAILLNDGDWITLANDFCDRRICSIAASVVGCEVQQSARLQIFNEHVFSIHCSHEKWRRQRNGNTRRDEVRLRH